ncbi:Response regulator PleD [Botrimarina colliarenosi]|uniref:diguanylate cyclase n=1 Tax=Botrimarina colliarenosi TaxID=2528001 RepID=A0A5C6AHP0_9BACT|nr:diguanylate cyclase [Botrimarina colliarenosi]TWT99514.1 Response regulator PleD [Botrimarina colliarenosi]
MDLLANAASVAPLVLVNLVFAAIAIGVGFAAGAWVGSAKSDRVTPSPDLSPKLDEHKLVLESTMLASDRLRDLAVSVASDVGAHNANIGAIEAQLSCDNADGAASAETVLRALEQIGEANQALQSKLAKAELQIQSQAELIRAHESEARTDSLTQLANRRAFDDEIQRRFAEWERFGTPFSLLILDVDHFKSFNDTHGHQAGDEVLRRVAQAITSGGREMDLACRYGGEEFAVVMPTTEGIDGGILAERVRMAIETMSIPFEGKRLSVTASGGLAGVEPGDNIARLVKRADEALYASKDAGRNNTHRHTNSVCVAIGNLTGQPDCATADVVQPETKMEMDALPNRTRFLELLRSEVRTSQQRSMPLSLVTADFRSYGRLKSEFGDAVALLTLDSIAQFLGNALQEGGCLGRLGESAFIALMPDCTAAAATAAGERINAALAHCSVPLGDGHLTLSTQMNVTELLPSDTAASFMERAESALGHVVSNAEPVLV